MLPPRTEEVRVMVTRAVVRTMLLLVVVRLGLVRQGCWSGFIPHRCYVSQAAAAGTRHPSSNIANPPGFPVKINQENCQTRSIYFPVSDISNHKLAGDELMIMQVGITRRLADRNVGRLVLLSRRATTAAVIR